jgi:hypothetical protein
MTIHFHTIADHKELKAAQQPSSIIHIIDTIPLPFLA